MARSFNGTSDFIDCSNSSTLNPTTLTISAWVYPTNLSGNNDGGFNECWVCCRDDNALGRSYTFGVRGPFGGNQYPELQINGTNLFNLSTGGNPVTTNAWWHLLVNGSNGGWTAYTNGAQAGTASNALTPANTTGKTTIGKRTYSGFEGWWPGRLADVAIWNVILTAGEAAGLATGARPYTVRPASLLGYWPLDGLASPEPDFSRNALNGSLTGTSAAAGPPATLFTPRHHGFADAAAAVAGGGYFRRMPRYTGGISTMTGGFNG